MEFIYTSDRGDNYEVSNMETSHLVNVIGHHRTQIATLRGLYQDHPHPALLHRVTMLENVIDVLADELIQRNVSDDEYITVNDGEGYDEY